MKAVLSTKALFESRREYPRARLNIPLSLQRVDGVIIKAVLYDLSPNGIQIRYTGDRADLLLARPVSSKDLKSIKYLLSFHLPGVDNTAAVNIEALPVYTRRQESGETAIGMLFDCALKTERDKILNFLMYLSEPDKDNDSNPGITESIEKNINSISSTNTTKQDGNKNELLLQELMRIRNNNDVITDSLNRMIDILKPDS
jgi:hypothetical protein